MPQALATPAFKALSALLTYPTGDLVAAVPLMDAALASGGVLAARDRAALAPLLSALAQDDLYDLQARYVELFDSGRKLSLHLFEHVHGESRDRGQAMVDLAALYAAGGLEPEPGELPDFLPLFLEYLSTRPLAEARGLIGETAHILAVLEARLAGKASPYKAVFSALRAVAGAAPAVAEEASAPGDDLAALDAAWEETAVTFGPGAAPDPCPMERLRTQMRAASRSAGSPANSPTS